VPVGERPAELAAIGAVGEPARGPEELEDLVTALVHPGDRNGAGHRPGRILGDHLGERTGVAAREGVEHEADALKRIQLKPARRCRSRPRRSPAAAVPTPGSRGEGARTRPPPTASPSPSAGPWPARSPCARRAPPPASRPQRAPPGAPRGAPGPSRSPGS